MAEVVKKLNEKVGNYRWTICALIFFATTINYLDRQVIGILKPILKDDLGIGVICRRCEGRRRCRAAVAAAGRRQQRQSEQHSRH